MTEIELDPELLADFISESQELLEEFSVGLIELENNPDNPDIIASIFRIAHTLKGSSAFFNLVHIKNFAHKLENLLDDLRNRIRPVTTAAISQLLTGNNHLINMFNRVRGGNLSAEVNPEEDKYLTNLIEFIETGEEAEAFSAEDVLAELLKMMSASKENNGDSDNLIRNIEEVLSEFAARMSSKADAGEGREAETGVGDAGAFYKYQETDFTSPVNTMMAVLTEAEKTENFDSEAFENALNEIADLIEQNNLAPLQTALAETRDDFEAVQTSAIGFEPILITMIRDKAGTLVGMMEISHDDVEQPDAETGPAADAEADKKPDALKPVAAERKTMRIDEEKVDGFMNYVGELIVTAESFRHLQKIIEQESDNIQTVNSFKNANHAFRELSYSLQEGLMEIRRVPLKGLFQKVTLLARELSVEEGKNVKVTIEDHDVAIDKSIAEGLEGPTIHLVRNSLDHGLETAEEREQAGKNPEGQFKVVARMDKEFFYMDLVDDGRGIDPVKIREAALSKGVKTEEQLKAMSDEAVINLVFTAGFSTAKKVTDISGRGVGMDVVRTNINHLNGTVHLESVPGQGTSVHLKIPLTVTLQVIKGLLVQVGEQQFIISLDDIIESLRPDEDEVSTIEGKAEFLMRRGEIFPMVRLADVFNIPSEVRDPTQGLLVIMKTTGGRFSLLVDKVVGQQQVVVKEMGPQFKELSSIAGSAILGDGRLGLVLDAEGLLKLTRGEA